MNKNNVKCVICSKEYKYCHDCNHTNIDTWKASFCCENCREIYRICAGYGMGHITKEDACNALAKCDLSEIKNYSVSTKKLIREIQDNINTNTVLKTVTPKVSKELTRSASRKIKGNKR